MGANSVLKNRSYISWATKPYLLIVGFLLFLLVRNWPVFLLWDVNDGFFLKTAIVSHGFGIEGFKDYVHSTVLHSFNGHFKPLWLLCFLGIVYFFDSNPWALGILSFGFAAILLYLLFRICHHFFGNRTNGYVYSLMVALAFSSTAYFLEIIAWKWMLCLLMSSVFFCVSLLILLEKKESLKWLIIYTLALLSCFWTFGTGWVLGWGLVLFLILSGYKLRNRFVLVTIVASILGTVLTLLVNQNSTYQPQFYHPSFRLCRRYVG